MKNDIFINSDGINVFIEIHVKSKLIGKIIMSIIMLLLLFCYFAFLIMIDAKDIGSILVPFFIISIVLIVFPLRYLFWNLFGIEYIVVNTKTISFAYSYGILTTKYKTIKFNRLASGFDTSKLYNETLHGTLFFQDFDLETNLPINIFETSVIIPYSELSKIDNEIRKVFYNEFLYENQFIPFSLN